MSALDQGNDHLWALDRNDKTDIDRWILAIEDQVPVIGKR